MLEAAFRGYALNAVDSKSRLSVPAAFRQTIEARSGSRSIFLGPAEHGDCLVGYDAWWSGKLLDRHDARFADDYSAAESDSAVLMFGTVEELAIDDAGRVVLSPTLRDLGNLGEAGAPALFLGGGNWFQIWHPRIFLARDGLDPRLARIVRAQIAAKKIEL